MSDIATAAAHASQAARELAEACRDAAETLNKANAELAARTPEPAWLAFYDRAGRMIGDAHPFTWTTSEEVHFNFGRESPVVAAVLSDWLQQVALHEVPLAKLRTPPIRAEVHTRLRVRSFNLAELRYDIPNREWHCAFRAPRKL